MSASPQAFSRLKSVGASLLLCLFLLFAGGVGAWLGGRFGGGWKLVLGFVGGIGVGGGALAMLALFWGMSQDAK